MSEEEDIADIDDEDDLLAEDREVEEREECVQDVLELIVERVNAHVDASELQRKVVGYAVREALKDSLAVVDMTFLERESFSTRSPATESEETIGSWFPDEEHVPGPIDAWARGTVRSRRRQRETKQDELHPSLRPINKLGATMGAPRASAARTSSASMLSKTGGDARLSSTSAPRKSYVTARELPKPKRKPRLSGEALEKELRLREEIEARRVVQQMQKLQLQKDQQELRQLDAMQKSMRGRDYGYDHNGELVLVNKLDPERMPAFAVGMKVKVMEKKETSAEASARRIKDLRASRLNEVDYIQPQESGQPSAMESMKMAKGVTLRQGGGAKSGPPLSSTSQNMGRREYMDSAGAQSSAPARGGLPAVRSLARGGSSSTSGGRFVHSDPNLQLLSAKDWGMNPPSAMKMKPYEPPTGGIPKARTPSTKSLTRRVV